MLLRSLLFIALFFAAALTPKNNSNAGSPSGRTLGQLELAEKLGINHPDQVVDFDYSTDTFPLYVAEADGTVIHNHPLSGEKLALLLRGGLRANDTRRCRILSGPHP